MLERLAARLRWDWSLVSVALFPLAKTEASPSCEIGYLYESRPLKAFNIVGTSRSYLKTLGNCLPRNNILTLAPPCQRSDNWDSSASDIIIASDLWLVTSLQFWPLIGWHAPGLLGTTIIIWIVAAESIFIFRPANTETPTLDPSNQIKNENEFVWNIPLLTRKRKSFNIIFHFWMYRFLKDLSAA